MTDLEKAEDFLKKLTEAIDSAKERITILEDSKYRLIDEIEIMKIQVSLPSINAADTQKIITLS
jgi:hypothetical protein